MNQSVSIANLKESVTMKKTKLAVIMRVGPGLGAACAKKFAAEGFTVAMLARKITKLKKIEKEIKNEGGEALSYTVDVANEKEIKAVFRKLGSIARGIELFVYNAGQFRMGGVMELSASEFVGAWNTNCLGAFLGAKEVLPVMSRQRKGTIIFTGATASLRGSAKFSALAVGKFALRALAQSLAREFGPKGIHVAHVVVDGIIATPAYLDKYPKTKRNTLISPESIAELYWDIYKQDRSAWTLETDLRPYGEKF